MTAELRTLTGSEYRAGPAKRPEGKLNRCEIGDHEALMKPVGQAFGMLAAGALMLKTFYGEEEAHRLIAAELETVGIRMEVRS